MNGPRWSRWAEENEAIYSTSWDIYLWGGKTCLIELSENATLDEEEGDEEDLGPDIWNGGVNRLLLRAHRGLYFVFPSEFLAPTQFFCHQSVCKSLPIFSTTSPKIISPRRFISKNIIIARSSSSDFLLLRKYKRKVGWPPFIRRYLFKRSTQKTQWEGDFLALNRVVVHDHIDVIED